MKLFRFTKWILAVAVSISMLQLSSCAYFSSDGNDVENTTAADESDSSSATDNSEDKPDVTGTKDSGQKDGKDGEDKNNTIENTNKIKELSLTVSNIQSTLKNKANASEINTTKEDFEKKIDKVEGKSKWIWISMLIGIIAIILVLITFNKYKSLKRSVDSLNKKIRSLEKERQNIPAGTSAKRTSSSEYEDLRRKIKNLEGQMHLQAQATCKPVQSTGQPINKPVARNESTKGYFGNPIQATPPYFRKVLSNRDNEARFSAEIRGNEAKFRPIVESGSIGTFVSIDSMRSVLDFAGCAPNEATAMTTMEDGVAVQKDGKWVIIKNVKVRLN